MKQIISTFLFTLASAFTIIAQVSGVPFLGEPAERTVSDRDLGSGFNSDLLDVEGPAYGMDYLGDQFFRFNLSNPAGAVQIGTIYHWIGGADFGPGGIIYAIDDGNKQLITVDSSNGNYTIIGPSTPAAGNFWTGIAWDQTTGTLYAVSTDGGESSLYTLDPATGTATIVGSTTVASGIVGIDFDVNGQLFAYCVNTDAIYYVNKSDGSATLLGSVGVTGASSPWHDISFNGETGELYIIAYSAISQYWELYKINLANGSGTYIGNLGNFTTAAFAISGDYIVPVELTYFNANLVNTAVELSWSTETETNNLGFQVERKSENTDWNNIALVPGFGTTTERHTYSYSDQSVSSGQYSYRLKQIDYNGSFEYSDIITVEVTVQPEFSLHQNYPNPFNPSTKIKYSVPQLSQVLIKVFDVLGNEVTTLVSEEKQAGRYELTWNAVNLPGGVYFYQLRAVDPSTSSGQVFKQTKKMILLK